MLLQRKYTGYELLVVYYIPPMLKLYLHHIFWLILSHFMEFKQFVQSFWDPFWGPFWIFKYVNKAKILDMSY